MDYLFTTNKHLNILRISSVISIIFILPVLFINIATGITFTIIALVALFVFLIMKQGSSGNEFDALKAAIVVSIILLASFVFIILSKVVFSLFIFFAITMLVVQEWAYRVFFNIHNGSDFFDSNSKNFWDWICYISILIFAILSLYNIIENSALDLEKLSLFKVIDIFNIPEQIRNNVNMLDLASANYSNGIKTVKGLGWNIIKYSSVYLVPYTAIQFLITFINKT